jgi:hypothetical protein
MQCVQRTLKPKLNSVLIKPEDNSTYLLHGAESFLRSQPVNFGLQRKSLSWVILNICFYGERLLAPRPTPKLEDHPSSAVHGCLFNIFTATLHIGVLLTVIMSAGFWFQHPSKRHQIHIMPPNTGNCSLASDFDVPWRLKNTKETNLQNPHYPQHTCCIWPSQLRKRY